MTSNLQNKDEIILKQVDSNDVITNSKFPKILNTNIADIADFEVEFKKTDIKTTQLNESEIKNVIPSDKDECIVKKDSSASIKENNKDRISSVKTENVIVKIENNEIKQTATLDNFDTDQNCEFLEEFTNHLDEEKNENIVIRVNKVKHGLKEEEDNIQDQELDHEIYEELDHEVDEEEINENTHNTVGLI